MDNKKLHYDINRNTVYNSVHSLQINILHTYQIIHILNAFFSYLSKFTLETSFTHVYPIL